MLQWPHSMPLSMRPREKDIRESCPLLTLLRSSPWPLSVPDIARTLDVDDITAALALRTLREAGRARLVGCLWEIT